MEEIVYRLKDYPRYGITDTGSKVIDMSNGREVKQGVQMMKGKPTGYMYVTLMTDLYESKRIAVHRLVAKMFVENPEGLPEVNHKDGNRSNNHFENLEWCSHRDNIIHSYRNGRVSKKGSEHHMFGRKVSSGVKKKMSEAKMGELHPKFSGWYVWDGNRYTSARQVEIATGVCQKKVSRICKKKPTGDRYFIPKV